MCRAGTREVQAAMAVWTGIPFGRGGQGFRLLDDPARLELLSPEALAAEAAACALVAHREGGSARARARLDQARLLREQGTRTGAADVLARAGHAARAALLSEPRGAMAAEARLEAAVAAMALADATGDPAHLGDAAEHLAEAAALRSPPAPERRLAAEAALACRRALAEGDADLAAAAGALSDRAVDALARAARGDDAWVAELALAQAERAALLTGFALRLRDAASAARAAADLGELLPRLDRERLPVLCARLARLRGEALTAEADLLGEPRKLAEASRLLTAALADLPAGHAPVERARLGRALGHAARTLAEAGEAGRDARALDAAAVSAFAAAAAELAVGAAPALRAELAFERALALAAAALRDPRAPGPRHAAEAALRSELIRGGNGGQEPAAWAAVQVALARLYASEPGGARRPEAALALEAALDVFAEAGLRTLAASAADALRALGRDTGQG